MVEQGLDPKDLTRQSRESVWASWKLGNGETAPGSEPSFRQHHRGSGHNLRLPKILRIRNLTTKMADLILFQNQAFEIAVAVRRQHQENC